MNAVLHAFIHACILLCEISGNPVAFPVGIHPTIHIKQIFIHHYNDRGCLTNGGTF